eukprot:3687636-Alexandrium_andersonii.AAC.1
MLRPLLGPRSSSSEPLKRSWIFRRAELRIEAACSTDGPWANCGLHFETLAMWTSQKLHNCS